MALAVATLAAAGYLWIGKRYDFFRGLMFAKWFRLFLGVFVMVMVAEWVVNNMSA